MCLHGDLNRFGLVLAGWGLGPDQQSRVVPTLVTGLLKTKSVVQVAAECLTADGLLFVCGSGTFGRLGIGDTERRLAPTLVRGELEG